MKKLIQSYPFQSQTFLFITILIFGLSWIAITTIFFPVTTNGSIPAPMKGFLAPDFNLQSMDGNFHKLSDYQDQGVILNFWTSWCPPCKAEMPVMEKVFKDFENQNIIFLAVNATQEDNKSNAITFVTQNQLTFPILFDDSGTVSHQYQIHSFPTTFFILPDGEIAEIVIGGPISEAMLRIRIENLLKVD